jgi:hypothetical protein
MFVQAVRILTVTTVGGPTTGLDVCDAVRFRSQDTYESFRVHCACADLNVIWLLKYATGIRPELLQGEDELLEVQTVIPNLMFCFSFQFRLQSSPERKVCVRFPSR